MKTNKQYRQGDVLIEALPKGQIPTGITPKKQNRIILAHGEVTGHAHELKNANGALLSDPVPGDQFRMAGDSDDHRGLTCMALVLVEAAPVEHQEHDAIALAAEEYRVTRQREYHPEAIRNVAD